VIGGFIGGYHPPQSKQEPFLQAKKYKLKTSPCTPKVLKQKKKVLNMVKLIKTSKNLFKRQVKKH
ncbi:unnamed protein product, partial [Larinioides sclopetarius]